MKTVLVVDDEPYFVEAIGKKCSDAGYRVLTAADGETALEVIRNEQIDLILLDILMPNMDGISVIYHLKNTLKREIPVVLLTNMKQSAYPYQVKDFLVKSQTSMEDLITKVKTYI